jgi:hypothetical protein
MSDYDEGYRAGMQKMREVGQRRIEELEAKLAKAVDRTEVIALIRKDAENGDISHGAAQWVIDTILAAQKGQE